VIRTYLRLTGSPEKIRWRPLVILYTAAFSVFPFSAVFVIA